MKMHLWGVVILRNHFVKDWILFYNWLREMMNILIINNLGDIHRRIILNWWKNNNENLINQLSNMIQELESSQNLSKCRLLNQILN